MSEAASRERAIKQHWAVPGSAHDKIVRWTKIVLPSAVGVLIAVLAVAPLGKHSDVSFILDKKKVETAQERMRVEMARYGGPTTRASGSKSPPTTQSSAAPTCQSSIFLGCSPSSTSKTGH
jgi:lipopolysaccharide export system protein LptC